MELEYEACRDVSKKYTFNNNLENFKNKLEKFNVKLEIDFCRVIEGSCYEKEEVG